MWRLNRTEIRNVIRWLLWVFIIQLLLINISGMLYAYKLTHFYEPSGKPRHQSTNVFIKTWKLFRGPKIQKIPEGEFPHLPYETVQLITRANDLINAWYLPSDSSRGTVVMVHGLGANKSFLLDEAYEFRYFGFNVMMIDLRAHGSSTGNTTTLGVRESEEVKLAYDFIRKKGEENIILYGVSLGAVVITKAIYDYDIVPSGVVLDMPFENLKKLLEGRARILGFPEEPFAALVTLWASIERGFNGFKHSTDRYAQKVKCPVLMQYGALDNLVTADETKSVFRHLASSAKKLVIYKNARHESFLRSDPQLWREEVGNFLSK